MINSDTTELLAGIYKLAKTGMQASKAVIEKAEDSQLREELSTQYINYFKTANEAESLLTKEGVTPNDNSPVTKAVMWGSIQLHTLGNVSTSHISEIMINGTTMGIIDLTKHLSECKNADETSKNMAKNFIHKEECYVDELKQFLGKR